MLDNLSHYECSALIGNYPNEAGDIENAVDYVERAAQESMRHISVMDQTDENGTTIFHGRLPEIYAGYYGRTIV